jgi:hypothetical protein
MKLRIMVSGLLLSFCVIGLAHAAGGPLNEDLTPLLPVAQKAVDAGKQGNAEAFVREAEEALKQAKARDEQRTSAALQRIVGKLKKAVSEGNAGRLAEGTQLVEEAMSDMKKSGSPHFGGGS